eukprot:g8502.t1
MFPPGRATSGKCEVHVSQRKLWGVELKCGSPALRRQAHSHFSFDVLQLQRRRNLPAPGMALPPYIRQDQGGQAKFRSVRSCSGTADLQFTDLPACPSTSLRTRPRRPSTSSASNEYTPRSPTGNLVGFGQLQDHAHLHHPQPVRVRFGEHDDRIEAGELDADA